MITRAALHEQLRGPDATGLEDWELEEWIARRWVLPEEQDGEYRFEEIDVARIRLIVSLRHEMQVEQGAVPVVLSLLDQLHDARRQLAQLQHRLRSR